MMVQSFGDPVKMDIVGGREKIPVVKAENIMDNVSGPVD